MLVATGTPSLSVVNAPLLDAEQAATNFPSTFRIPPKSERDAVVPGDRVQVGFLMKFASERLWLGVILPGVGRLIENPRDYNARAGDCFAFEPKHIIKIKKRTA
jgi:hypothetical protein